MAATVYNSVELDATATKKSPLHNGGQIIKTVIATITIDVNSADGDVVILAPGLPISAKVVGLRLPTVISGITQLSSVSFGFYKQAGMKATDLVSAIPTTLGKGVLCSALDLSSAKAANVDILTSDRAGTIGSILTTALEANQEPAGGVNLCATIDTQGSGTGTIEVAIDIAYPA